MNRSLHRALYSCALLLITLMMSQTAALALPSDTLTLSRGWTFSEHGSSEVHPATVPGVVQQDLIRLGKLPDPYYRLAEDSIQWVGERVRRFISSSRGWIPTLRSTSMGRRSSRRRICS